MLRTSTPLEKGFTHITAVLVIGLFISLIASTNISTTTNFPQINVASNVLGENEDESAKQAEETAKKAQEQAKEDVKRIEEQQKKAAKKLEETISPDGSKVKIQTEGNKSETEIETKDGQKIKTKIEDDGKTKIKIEQGKLKLKYVFEGKVLKLKAENEDGDKVELDDDELQELENEIEDKLENEGIGISTASGKPVLIKNRVAATLNFPLSIDAATNQLIVTTPAGQKIVTILPDQAVSNLLAANIINRIDSSEVTSIATQSGTLSGIIKLEIRNDRIVYKVSGEKTHNLLGFIPVATSKTVFVSAEDGQPVAQEQSLLANLADLLSF